MTPPTRLPFPIGIDQDRTVYHLLVAWLLAPVLPLMVGAVVQEIWESASLTLRVVNLVSAPMVAGLYLASIWGAARIETWLKATDLPFSSLIGLPLGALMLLVVSAQYARSPIGIEGLVLEPASSYGLMLGIWALLASYQLKPFWDHAKEAWRRDGLQVVWREFPPPWAWKRRKALDRRRRRVAHAWQVRLAEGPLATPERAALDQWCEDRTNRAALRRARPRPRLAVWFLGVGLGLMLAGELWRLLHA